MPWTAVLAIVALLAAQLAITGVSLYAYNRIRSKEDTAGLRMDNWTARLELAVATADTAKAEVKTIEVTHYKVLRSMFEEQILIIGELKGKVKALEVELALCNKKLASEARIGRRDRAKEAAEAATLEDDQPTTTGPGGIPPEVLAQLGGIPLQAQSAAPAAPRPSNFGKVVR